MSTAFRIKAEEDKIHPHILDLIGADFGGDHAKGLAEWVKNSIDAYNNDDVPDSEQYVILEFQVAKPKKHSVFRCVDFVGMTSRKIEESFKTWGDPDAATRFARDRSKRALGGHGNGGKFYMRQMFEQSEFVTYRDGRLNVFGFSSDKRYGYADAYRNVETAPERALQIAGLGVAGLPEAVRRRLEADQVRFTVVIGVHPEHFSKSATVEGLCQRLRTHPQVSRLLLRKPIYVKVGDQMGRLEAEHLPPKPGLPESYSFQVPHVFGDEDDPIDLTLGGRMAAGELRLWTSDVPLRGDRAERNAIDFLGEIGCIASHKMSELGWFAPPAAAEFVYGECECVALEGLGCVRNDRTKLVDKPLTQQLLAWVAERVRDVAAQIVEQEEAQGRHEDLSHSAAYNDLLNQFTERFVEQLSVKVPSGGTLPGDGDGNLVAGGSSGVDAPGGASGQGPGGGPGGGAVPPSGAGGQDPGDKAPNDHDRHDGNNEGGGVGDGRVGTDGKGAGSDESKAKRPPKVLLSGYDADPLDETSTIAFQLSPRHPEVYQRPQDLIAGIYWINTSRPMAKTILGRFGQDSPQWREYLFQRHVDVIVKNALYQLNEDSLTPELVDQTMDQTRQLVMDAAAERLEDFLFESEYASR